MLTDAAVKGAKPREKAYKLHDSGGLYLLVQPRGGRYWRMDYRFEGRRKTLALGVYDRVGLKDARGKRDAARAMLDAGTDPSHAKKLSKIAQRAAANDTCGAIADEDLEKLEREGRSPATMGKKRWLLEFAKSGFGNRPISKIEAPELLDVLRKIEGRGHYETARRVRANCGEVFRYGIATGRARRDVAADLRGALIAPTVKHHAAITEPKEIGQLLRAIDGYAV